MFSFTRTASLFLILVVPCFAQQPPRPQPAAPSPTSNISGRVTVGDKGVAGITVAVMGRNGLRPTAAARGVTGADGNYLLTGVPPGQHMLWIQASAYVPPFDPRFGPGKTIIVYPGETIENIDFKLQRGAVITGRVTDGEGAPVLVSRVNLYKIDEHGQALPYNQIRSNYEMSLTDDRGVYRLYGLPPGRYKISCGYSAEGDMMPGMNDAMRRYFRRAFHPDATDQAQARVITLGEGEEATDIDIKLGERETTYRVKGRVIDAETNQPVPYVRLGVGTIASQGERAGSVNGVSLGQDHQSDANGEFNLFGIVSGRHVIFAQQSRGGIDTSEHYGDPVHFEVADRDVSGVEVKVSRGATLSGAVVEEGTATKKAPTGQVMLMAQRVNQSPSPSTHIPGMDNRWVRVETDGQFHIGGLPPGKFNLMAMSGDGKALVHLRVERGGVEQPQGVDVAAGESISDVRVVVQRGTGTINGTVKIAGGELPPDFDMHVSAQPLNPIGDENARQRQRFGSSIDQLGRFVIQGLPSGEYELTLMTSMTSMRRSPMAGGGGGGGGGGGRGRRPPSLPPQKQSVSVGEGARAEVTFTLDLSALTSPPSPLTQEAAP